MYTPMRIVIRYVRPDVSKSTSKFGMALNRLMDLIYSMENAQLSYDMWDDSANRHACGNDHRNMLNRCRDNARDAYEDLNLRCLPLYHEVRNYLLLACKAIAKHKNEYVKFISFAAGVSELYYGAEYLNMHPAIVGCEDNADVDINIALLLHTKYSFNVPVTLKGATLMFTARVHTPELQNYVLQVNNVEAFVSAWMGQKTKAKLPAWFVPKEFDVGFVSVLLKHDPKADLCAYFEGVRVNVDVIGTLIKRFPKINFAKLLMCNGSGM